MQKGYCGEMSAFTGLISVPDKIPVNTLMIDLQNNDITEIKEDDFKGMDKLYVRQPSS